MCFSAGASFTGGVVLSSIGIVTIKTNTNTSNKLFAGIPLLFAFQQFSEGVIWLTLRSGGNMQLQSFATYIFLLLALVIWPTLIPVSLLKMEADRKKQKLLRIFTGAGLILSVYYSVCLILFPVTPVINQFHIQYINGFPALMGYIAFGIYAVATIAPMFISTVKRMKLFGWLIFFSCFITGIFYKEYLTSVWCFFAAIISIVVFLIIKEADSETHFQLRAV